MTITRLQIYEHTLEAVRQTDGLLSHEMRSHNGYCAVGALRAYDRHFYDECGTLWGNSVLSAISQYNDHRIDGGRDASPEPHDLYEFKWWHVPIIVLVILIALPVHAVSWLLSMRETQQARRARVIYWLQERIREEKARLATRSVYLMRSSDAAGVPYPSSDSVRKAVITFVDSTAV